MNNEGGRNASQRAAVRRAHSWEFTFTDLQSGKPVISGVFATSFGSARDKALAQLASENGSEKGRYAYCSYRRLI